MAINFVHMFYTSMISPRVTGSYNPQSELLENVYKNSIKVLKETIDSVHSKTLDELYTDEFKPSHIKSNTTKIKSLKTGKPIDIDIKYALTDGKSETSNHRLKYYAYLADGNSYLGSKTFGIKINSDHSKTFEGGFITSAHNDEYAGVQIRLLQAACEEANRNGIKKMPLYGLLPAINFHTMMGFRPLEHFNEKITSLSDIEKAIENMKIFHPVSGENITPILSKKNNQYFFDANRTLYCNIIQRNQKLINQGKRHLPLKELRTDSAIDMELSGEEFDKWIERSKGFEITPDTGTHPKKFTFWDKVIDFINTYKYGG